MIDGRQSTGLERGRGRRSEEGYLGPPRSLAWWCLVVVLGGVRWWWRKNDAHVSWLSSLILTNGQLWLRADPVNLHVETAAMLSAAAWNWTGCWTTGGMAQPIPTSCLLRFLAVYQAQLLHHGPVNTWEKQSELD
jgi:hypothetical protein